MKKLVILIIIFSPFYLMSQSVGYEWVGDWGLVPQTQYSNAAQVALIDIHAANTGNVYSIANSLFDLTTQDLHPMKQ